MPCFRPAIAAALALVVSALPAAAGEIADKAAEAETLLDGGKPVQALAAIEAAFNSVWDKAPLSFSEALFVSERPEGFGVYKVRATSAFKPGEDMLVYAEPFGYGYGETADGFAIAFDADFELRTTGGQILHREDSFAVLDMKTQRRNKEFQIFITYSFEGLKPGEYILVTRLRDRNSSKTGSFDLPFQIVAESTATP